MILTKDKLFLSVQASFPFPPDFKLAPDFIGDTVTDVREANREGILRRKITDKL